MVWPPHLDALPHQRQLAQARLPLLLLLPPRLPGAGAPLALRVRMPLLLVLPLLLLQQQQRGQLLCRCRLLFLANSLLAAGGRQARVAQRRPSRLLLWPALLRAADSRWAAGASNVRRGWAGKEAVAQGELAAEDNTVGRLAAGLRRGVGRLWLVSHRVCHC